MAMLKIASIDIEGAQVGKVLSQPVLEHKFRVDYLALSLSVTAANADATNDQVLKAANFLAQLKLTWNYADGQKMVDNVPYAALGLMAYLIDQGQLPDPAELARSTDYGRAAGTDTYAKRDKYTNVVASTIFADFQRGYRTSVRDRVIQKSATAQVETFNLFLPLRDNNALRPLDFSQALSLIGELTVVMPGTNLGGANLSIENYTITVFAIGEYVDEFVVGARKCYHNESMLTPQNTQTINLRGRPLRALLYTTNIDTSPLAQVGITVKIDSQKPIIDMSQTPISAIAELGQWLGSGPPWDGAALTLYTAYAPLFQPATEFSILAKRRGSQLNLEWEDNPGAAGKQFLMIEEIVQRKRSCARRLPGMSKLTPGQMATVLQPVQAGPGIVSDDERDWLPASVPVKDDELESCD